MGTSTQSSREDSTFQSFTGTQIWFEDEDSIHCILICMLMVIVFPWQVILNCNCNGGAATC